MTDAEFPSGEWTGFYNYRPGDRHRMDLQLAFTNGAITGSGNDDVGQFVIKGTYNSQNRECWWSKTYTGAHTVLYRGFREGKGIWGTWDIGIFCHGGFHIWPRKVGEGIGNVGAEESGEPVEAVATTAEERTAAVLSRSSPECSAALESSKRHAILEGATAEDSRAPFIDLAFSRLLFGVHPLGCQKPVGRIIPQNTLKGGHLTECWPHAVLFWTFESPYVFCKSAGQ